MVEFNLQDHVQALQDENSYHIPNEIEVEGASDNAISATLEEAIESVTESSDSITNLHIFDIYRSLLKHFDALPPSVMSKMLDSITSAFQAEVESVNRDLDADERPQDPSRKTALEMYAFLIQWYVKAAEKHSPKEGGVAGTPAPKTKGRKGTKAAGKQRAGGNKTAGDAWLWPDQVPPTLAVLSKILRDLRTHRLWTSTVERDIFINCITKPAYHIMESEAQMKRSEIKLSVYKVICLAVKKHGHGFGAQISIMQCLQYFEHLSEPMAEILAVLHKEFDHTQLAEEILREVSAKNFNGQDTKGPRSFSRFLIHLADLSPRVVHKQFTLLQVHLDSEAYPMRVALVEIVGMLIKETSLEGDEGAGGDGEQQENHQEGREKNIRGLFELLLERFCDVSSYVRVKVINTISKLWELRVKLPKQRTQTTALVIAALEDKASSVRRYAIALLTKMILTHPYGAMYGGLLNLEEWENRYAEVKKQLEKVELREIEKTPHETAEEEEEEDEEEEEEEVEEGEHSERRRNRRDNGDGSEEDDEADGEDQEGGSPAGKKRKGKGRQEDEADNDAAPPKKKKKRSKTRKSALDLAGVSQEQAIDSLDLANITRFRLTKRYIADALRFIRQVEGAMDVMGQLLGSTSKAEVLESMEFFKVAHEYHMASAIVGIKNMLHLIWTKDNSSSTAEDGKELKGIRSRLIECYRSLYFDPVPDAEPKQQINRIAKNMIDLTHNASLAELTSLEELMRTMVEDNQVHPDVINTLWQVYSAEREIPRYQRRGAIIIIGMFAVARRDIVTERIDTLLKIGLGAQGKADITLARYTCVALQRLSGSVKKVKGSLTDKSMRLPMENPIFRKLQDAMEHPCNSKDWFGMAEQAINTIYLLGEQPDRLCDDIIKSFTRRVFTPETKEHAPEADRIETEDDLENEAVGSRPVSPRPGSAAAGDASVDKGDVGKSFHLSQLVFIVGHIAIKHIVYLELVERELKRRKDVTAKEKQRDGDLSKSNNRKEIDELEQVAGSAEDDTGERIARFREDEMLYGEESLLALFGPIIVHICGTPKKFKNQTLRTAATLALSKFMCVSSHFCEAHLLLLFKILETSKDATIRSNVVIALGDVAVCFSNMIDENSNKLYEGLSDKNMVVKKNTLMVLTHLILNGMVKVKGQLGEMAKCLEDEDTRIADLAKLFFTELSGKDNAIYNNLPDVISHLSVGDHAVDEEAFQRTMRYIFTFVEKEKQAESIVEKLCQRFRLTSDPRQWRDIAFCLSLLPFKSERSMKKLIDGLPFYQDKLHEPTVFNRFNEILTKARTNKSANKPDNEMKEFEQILTDFKEKGEEDQELEQTMQKKTAAAKKKAATRKTTRGRGRKAATPPPSDSE